MSGTLATSERWHLILGGIVLAICSAILSGLTLGLMGLDVLQLRILIEAAEAMLGEQPKEAVATDTAREGIPEGSDSVTLHPHTDDIESSTATSGQHDNTTTTATATADATANARPPLSTTCHCKSSPCMAASRFFNLNTRRGTEADRIKLLRKQYRRDETFRQAERARRIYLIRKDGNLLLVTLLIGNVSVNAAFAILMESLTSGILGFLLSTVVLTILGEIIPQAVCSRHGLAIGYYFTPLVIVMEVLLYPIAKPIALALDCALGTEVGTEFNRRQLKALVGHHHTQCKILEDDEAKIMEGGLEFGLKPVSQVMTPLSEVYGIDINSRLNFETVAAMVTQGYSRIPVFDWSHTQSIIGLVHIKDMILLDPSRNLLLADILPDFGRPVYTVESDAPLGTLLKDFKKGHTHLAVVREVEEDPSGGDPFYRHVGVISLEDIIEEILQDEIYDEHESPGGSPKRSKVVRRKITEGLARRWTHRTSTYLGALEHVPKSPLSPPSRSLSTHRRLMGGPTSRPDAHAYRCDALDVELWRHYYDLPESTTSSSSTASEALSALTSSRDSSIHSGGGENTAKLLNIPKRCQPPTTAAYTTNISTTKLAECSVKDALTTKLTNRGKFLVRATGISSAPNEIKQRLCNANDHFRMLLFDETRGLEGLSQFEAVVLAIFLSTSSFLPFSSRYIKHNSLVKLLLDRSVQEPLAGQQLIRRGRPLSSCYIILRGHISVVAGDGEFESIVGPWNVLGVKALGVPPFNTRSPKLLMERMHALDRWVTSRTPYSPSFNAIACLSDIPPRVVEIGFEAYSQAVRESLRISEEPEPVRSFTSESASSDSACSLCLAV